MSHKALQGVSAEALLPFAQQCVALESLIFSGTKNCVEETRDAFTDFLVKLIETSGKLTQIKVPVFSEKAEHGNKILRAIVDNADVLGRLQLLSVNEQGSWWKDQEYGQKNQDALI